MYQLSPLTNADLIELFEALEALGIQLLKLKALHVAEQFELEELLEATGDEMFQRALDDAENIPERNKDE